VPGEWGLSLGQKLFNAKMTERGFAVKRSGANGSRDWHALVCG